MWIKELPKNSGFYFYIETTGEKMIVEVSVDGESVTVYEHGNEIPLSHYNFFGGKFWDERIAFPSNAAVSLRDTPQAGKR